jgi:RNA-directed DNA polymerase
MRPHARGPLAAALAAAFLAAGPWSLRGLRARGALTFGVEPPWLAGVARRVLDEHDVPPRDAPRALAAFIDGDEAFREACAMGQPRPLVARLLVPEVTMGETRWPVPPLATAGDLATWLALDHPSQLEGIADPRGWSRLARAEALRHYRYAWRAKPSGGYRLLEAPKPRLKALQRRILREVLAVVPPHDAAHGFREGRSVSTHAGAHAGRAVVVKLDLEDFFLGIGAAHVRAVFRALGYPEEVAHLLTSLCTTVAPVSTLARAPLPPVPSHADVAARHQAELRARTRHLPQGAPTSPALANLCAFGLDVRLSAAARSFDAVYTRYADDLVFSGDATFARRAVWFTALAGGITADEGFRVNHRKTRRTGQGGQQRVCGLVVNDRARVPRAEYDRLRAILTNCARTGLAAQNRDGHPDFRRHLEGRVAWVSSGDPHRAERLRALLARVG